MYNFIFYQTNVEYFYFQCLFFQNETDNMFNFFCKHVQFFKMDVTFFQMDVTFFSDDVGFFFEMLSFWWNIHFFLRFLVKIRPF